MLAARGTSIIAVIGLRRPAAGGEGGGDGTV
jgi:hypothetical protein